MFFDSKKQNDETDDFNNFLTSEKMMNKPRQIRERITLHVADLERLLEALLRVGE